MRSEGLTMQCNEWLMLPDVGDQSPVPGSDQETLVTLTRGGREDTGGRKVHVSVSNLPPP